MSYKKIVASAFARVSKHTDTNYQLITYRERGVTADKFTRIDLCGHYDEKFGKATMEKLCEHYEIKFANLTLNESKDILYSLSPYLDKVWWESRASVAAHVIIALQSIDNLIINNKFDKLIEKIEKLENKE